MLLKLFIFTKKDTLQFKRKRDIFHEKNSWIRGFRKHVTSMLYNKCEQLFNSFHIFRHVLEVHKKEKRHRCQICEKSFFKLSSKKRHELTHVTHDTWKCSSCMKIFKDSSSLKYHVRKKVCTKKTKLSQKSSIVLE